MAIAEIENPEELSPSLAVIAATRRTESAFYSVLLTFGAFLWWATSYHASLMPVWAPWDFSWLWFLATALALWWYGRGLARTPANQRPAVWRSASYVVGVLVIYAVLQTRFEYLAEHMFFINRLQHIAMHHLGPFLIALAWPGASIRGGMPMIVRRLVDASLAHRVLCVFQQPVLACFLFVGLIDLWLIPTVHFRAMIDPKLYQIMNWSMVIDGILFWTVVLDPRRHPPAPVSFGGRVAMALVVAPPQIVLGAIIAFSPHDIYAFYAWCGRIYPSMDALADQQLGGLNIWIPSAMMSGVALILVLNTLRLRDEEDDKNALLNADEEPDDGAITVSAASWTGL